MRIPRKGKSRGVSYTTRDEGALRLAQPHQAMPGAFTGPASRKVWRAFVFLRVRTSVRSGSGALCRVRRVAAGGSVRRPRTAAAALDDAVSVCAPVSGHR